VTTHVGQPLRRKEDPRLITGRARYTDDFTPQGTLWCAFVRSPEAHAKIVSIDKSAAEARDGVLGVFTGDDMADLGILDALPMAWVPPEVEVRNSPHWPLARGEVNHVGDPVAVVVGEGRADMVDAANEIFVDYEPLPAVTDIEKALDDGSPLVHEELGTNESHQWSLAGGDMDAAWAESDTIIERRVVNHRIAGAPIECRGVVAEHGGSGITITSSTQVPHFLRLFAALLLGESEEKVRVIAPEVGGGFGAKLQIYGEEILLAALARRLGRPVKWIETRSENMMVTHQGRDQVAHVKMGAKADGTLTGIHVRIAADMGAYLMLLTPTIPALGAFVMSGCYKFAAVQTDITGVYTNKCPTDAIRGAGRPEATHMIEVCMDQLAVELGIDRVELRRKNFFTEFPAETALGIVYDSGNYGGTLDKLLTHFDRDAFEREREEAKARGKLLGCGFSTYTEICGLAPSRVTGPAGFGLQTGLWESAMVRVHFTGAVTAYTGTSPHGQGQETTFAQVIADRLGCDPQVVEIMHGDTGTGPHGLGTYGSRTTAVGGEALVRATDKVVEKAKKVVAHVLEAAPEDIEVADGKFSVKGSPDKGMTLAEVAGAAFIPGEGWPEDMEPGLEETAFYDPSNFVFPFGAHAAVVEIDPETGKVDVVRYIAVDDCGPAINPMLIDGQVHGGVVFAIGQALYEQVHYDDSGQLSTGNFVNYCLPSAADVPSIQTDRTETPSPVNQLGVKGIGEAGTIAASAAVTNAVIDALRSEGVTYMDMPLTPVRVWEALQS
jgi:carbon-monoxide dehydrogenase large subunit